MTQRTQIEEGRDSSSEGRKSGAAEAERKRERRAATGETGKEGTSELVSRKRERKAEKETRKKLEEEPDCFSRKTGS